MRRRYQQPSPLPPAYEAHLTRFNADVVKRLARFWVGAGASKMGKEACARAIVNALADPKSVRTVIERLSDFERAGLGLLKLHGHIAPTEELAMELLMLGLPFQGGKRGYFYSSSDASYYEALNALIEHGLVLLRDWNPGLSYGVDLFVSQYRNRPEVFSDPRLLAHVKTVPPTALDISPVSDVEAELVKRPAEVVLRFVAFAEALRKLGRMELTAKGRVSKPFLAKLIKRLGWEDTLARESYTPLPSATSFFFALFEAAGLLSVAPNVSSITLDSELTEVFEWPYEEQAEVWVRAYRSVRGWIEYRPESVRSYDYDPDSSRFGKFNAMRAALVMALGALPDPGAWYRISDLSDAIYNRIGERFALGSFYGFYAPYNATPQDIEHKRRAWRQELYNHWVKNEHPWIVRAITGPLFHLGLVELAFEPGKKKDGPVLFRLTELGRAAMYDAFRSTPGAERTAPRADQKERHERCWVVQPNFDLVVYLDRASASRLAFIERIAERRPSQGATALYHLTRETVYQALESGIEPDTLIQTLERSGEYPLPENIRRTLEDWIARRERLTVHRAAALLEFADAAARDAALADKSFAGVPIGDRFLILSGRDTRKLLAAKLSHAIDYHNPPVRCVSASEDGTLTINRTRADLLVRGELASWSEPDSAGGDRWRITESSIGKAIGSGWTIEHITECLLQRVERGIPALLSVAMHAWAGTNAEPASVAVASDLILQVTSERVAAAIAASAMLRPYFRGQLGPRTFLVRHEVADELCRKLKEFGLDVGSDLAAYPS